MAPHPLVVGAPSYGALPGRMRCGPYRGEERNLQEVPSRHGAAQRLAFAYKGGVPRQHVTSIPALNRATATSFKS